MINALVMGSSPTGLYALRGLAKAGLSAALVDTAKGCAFQSRHVRGTEKQYVGSISDINVWMDRVVSGQTGKILLIPTSDVFIEFIVENAALLSQHFVFASCYHGIAARLLDKAEFHALCHEHGMQTPGIWVAEDLSALSRLADTLAYPCILKPTFIHKAKDFLKGRKVLLAMDRDAFLRGLDAIPDESGGWMVQEIIPGAESEITLYAGYVDKAGLPIHSFTARKLRQYPPGFGSASMVSSQPCEETRALAVDFLQRIGFKGICGAEFKRDARDGRLKIIEINPRPTLWFEISQTAGMRVMEAAARDMLDGTSIPEAVQHPGVVWRYALKDLASARFYRRYGADFVFPPPDVSMASECRIRSWPVFASDDPLPALAEPVNFLRKAWKRAT